MGHASDETLQDILIRTKRMQGCEALWMPGTDHAGIATQIKVVEENCLKGGGPDPVTTSAARSSLKRVCREGTKFWQPHYQPA